MFPMPQMTCWSVSSALSGVVRSRRIAAKRSQPTTSSTGSMPRSASSGTLPRSATPSPPTASRAYGRDLDLDALGRRDRDVELAEHPRVDVAQLAALGEARTRRGCAWASGPSALRARSSWPRHAEVHDEVVARVEADDEVLAEPPDRLDRVALEQRAELLHRLVPLGELPVGDASRLDLLAGELARERRIGRSRPRAAQASRSSQAARAAASSAAFLEVPSPAPATRAGDRAPSAGSAARGPGPSR